MSRETKIIALTGKGGVGKTSISAALVKLLVEEFPEEKILAIDADPAIGLAGGCDQLSLNFRQLQLQPVGPGDVCNRGYRYGNHAVLASNKAAAFARSEERRVGKEC